jgi:hypothetical protein
MTAVEVRSAESARRVAFRVSRPGVAPAWRDRERRRRHVHRSEPAPRATARSP